MDKPKFIKNNGDEQLECRHYEYCQQYHLPFIMMKDIGKDKCEIFYDVTNLSVDLELISDEVKSLFVAYKKFFLLDEYFGVNYMDNYYFFSFPVFVKHSECIANQLFDFLVSKIDGRS